MSAATFDIRRDALLGEEVWLATTAHGLRVRVVPTDRFREAAAMVTFRYGSVDLGFDVGGTPHTSPEGVAHYLEHKLFEDESIAAFDRFARRGAKVNAMTGFARTSYHFVATDRVLDNLEDLLHLVGRAHVTAENVEKERGIIAQELRMYEDSPDYRLFFDCVGSLYAEHPVRHPVGGTVESIQRITADELLACYAAFYCTGNAALAVAGPVDPQEIVAAAAACALRPGAAAPRRRVVDSGERPPARTQRVGQVPRPKLMLGCRDAVMPATPLARLHRQLVTEIVLDRLFSAASEVREDLHRRGVVDDSLSATYMGEEDTGFALITAETDAPDATADALQQALAAPLRLDGDYLERVRRKWLGKYVRSFGAVRNLAFTQAQEALDDIAPFEFLERLHRVGAAEIEARRQQLFGSGAFARAVMTPAP